MADYGFKVSKSGFDVNTTADKNLVFTSKYQTLMAKAFGTWSITSAGAGTYTTTIAHGLAYIPAFVVYGDCSTGFVDCPSGSSFKCPYVASGFDYIINAFADGTNLTVELRQAVAGNKTFAGRYFIFYQKGAT